MACSLLQTLFCVLLIQGGLYALHLTDNPSSGISSSNSAGSASNNNNHAYPTNSHMMQVLSHQSNGNRDGMLHNKPKSMQQHNRMTAISPGRLADELADLAQMERERLMMLDLAKQTANAAAIGHHGRPIITGRIQMTPAEDVVDSVDYANAMLQPQSQMQRNYLFGSVVKQPPRENDDYDSAGEFDGGGRFTARRRPIKYEYGRVVQPAEHEFETQNMDLDDFMELEVAEPEIEDIIPDLDGYQYLDELLSEQNNNNKALHNDEAYNIVAAAAAAAATQRQQHQQQENPYALLEDELQVNPPQALQELFEKERKHEREQHDEPAITAHKELLPKTRNGYNIRLQQKWQRKRNQQIPLQRNIFNGHQKHHFNNMQYTKFSLANSEATATKHIGNKNANFASSSSAADEAAKPTETKLIETNKQSNSNQAENINQNQATSNKIISSAAASSTAPSSSSLPSSSTFTNGATNNDNKHLRDDSSTAKEHLLQSNHKRSGALSGIGYGSTVSGGLQPPPVSHSIASQLMLRTARGQRQYDVPQIECPTAMDGMERFACPTPDLQGRYRCIDDHVLCDGFIDCPEGEDEDRRSCMFYKTTKAHLDVLADALLRWARGR